MRKLHILRKSMHDSFYSATQNPMCTQMLNNILLVAIIVVPYIFLCYKLRNVWYANWIRLLLCAELIEDKACYALIITFVIIESILPGYNKYHTTPNSCRILI